MKNLILKTTMSVTLLCLGVAVSPVQAATGVGKAIISIGKVFSTNKAGVKSKLKRRGKVFEGDTIKVGEKSRLQLRFIDNQLVVLKANTVFRIDEYKFKDKNDQNKSAALSLLKGGMRSVTGLIGKSARDKYKVKTPVATMGVRGTHYVIQLCEDNCGEGVQGIVGTVLQGQIVMSNDGGSRTFGTDQFFNVPSMDEAPKTITNPPATLISRSETSLDEDGDNGDSGGGSNDGDTGDGTDGGDTTLAGDDTSPPPSDEGGDTTSTTTTTDGGTFTSSEQGTVTTTMGTVSTTTVTFIAGTAAPAGAVLIGSGISSGVDGAGGGVAIQGVTGNIGLATVNMVGNQPVYGSFVDQMGTADYGVIAGAVAGEQGGNGMLGVNWGRWASNDIVFKDGGVDSSLSTGLAFVYSDNLTPIGSIPTSGFLSYDISGSFGGGGPAFLDETGAVVTGFADFNVSFFNQEIDFAASLSGNGRTYNVSSSVIPLPSLLAGGTIPLTSSCMGCPAGITSLTGDAGGVFVGPNAEGFIGYFGLNGSGVDGMGNPVDIGVSGAGLGIGQAGGD